MAVSNYRLKVVFLGLVLTQAAAQFQNGRGFQNSQQQGFAPLIVNSPPSQNRLPATTQQFGTNSQFQPQFQPQQDNQQFQQSGQRFQQQQAGQNNQQFQQQPPQNTQFQQQVNQPQQQILQQAPTSSFAPASQQPAESTNSEKEKSMSETCLACICQASTNCKLSTPCMSGGQYCGPFLISKPYWIDSGKPTLIDDNVDRDGAFEDCSTDPICAAQTVRKYMNKFRKDCNGDGKIDCEDLTRIHLMGPFDCANPDVPNTVFYRKFKQCWNRVLQFSEE